MLEARHLTVALDGREVLQDLFLSVPAGQFVLITGATGCGKSTLALTLAGLIPQAQEAVMRGRVRVGGLDTRERPLWRLAEEVGIVFQNPTDQLFNPVVADEVAFAPRNLGLDEEEVRGRTAFALEAVGITALKDRFTPTLSAGEKQRVAIASALSLQPRMLLLDEPTANLDWQGVEGVAGALRELNRRLGMTILVFEHRLNAFFQAADRVLIMASGRFVADGSPGEVLADRRRLTDLGLRFPWPQVEGGCERYVPEGIDPPANERRPLVTLREVEAGYGRKPALEGVDFSLYPGEFIALVGRNGAGKSTLARVIAGLQRPSRGRVVWTPQLRQLPLGRRAGLLFQNASEQLLCDTVEEEVAMAPLNFGLKVPVLAESSLAAAGLEGLRSRLPSSLSIGEQQRAALAAVMAADPALLILDEPTLGQDWGHLSALMEHLGRLAERGKAVLVITHDDKLVCRFARRILLLENGKIAADGLPRDASSTAPLARLAQRPASGPMAAPASLKR